jgi:hypothetical protein
MGTEQIPQTDSIDELAKFWQTHDLTDFEEELNEPAEPVFGHVATVKLRLPSGEADAVARIAAPRGIEPAELIREWVAERVLAGE